MARPSNRKISDHIAHGTRAEEPGLKKVPVFAVVFSTD